MAEKTERYDHTTLDKKWQEEWERQELYKTEEDSKKEKKYVLDMFPYPSGEGLHVGHPKGYIATDVYSRYSRMSGFNVLHPMGWDAFGLPAENYALKHKVHPREAVEKNIATFKQQLARIGFDYDWGREINTTDPEFYKWTQWIFLQLFKKGLAYQSDEPINWCPSCMTGLANEDLDGDECERCGSKVEKKKLPQWVLKITDYADRMLADLDTLEWPEHIKEAQRNWIGRSEGAKLDFKLTTGDTVTVFTTRPDTLFGATYMVLAPEHPLVEKLQSQISNAEEVKQYVEEAARKNEIERTAEGKEKTGVQLKGVMAVHPANGEEIPIFIADYVLGGYGTGAIMAVPAHDERDHAFARKFGLPIKQVIIPVTPDLDNPPRQGKEDTFRKSILAIVYDPKRDVYLTLKWKTQPWRTFITGGIEGDEDPVVAAQREIKEETGYTDVKLVRVLGGMTQAEFFATHKDVNRRIHGTNILFELASDAKEEVSQEEKDQYDIEWLTAEQVKAAGMRHGEFALIWERLESGKDEYTGDGVLINSGEYDGQPNREASSKIVEKVGGQMTTTYKIKDWVFSRQRYWGEPIPIVHCTECGAVPVPEDELPVLLPEVESYEPSGTGESPLANIEEWVNVACPKCGGAGKRETNTMPQWAGSSWYYLRFMDPKNSEQLVAPNAEKYWAPVDVYVGGDHAVRHLIYARFWHKFLYDIGAVSTSEPFARLEFLGFILAEDGRKMSKRFGNVINPDDVVAQYGADAFRVYEMFMGPFENTVAWSTDSINGTARFLDRVWRMAESVGEEREALDTTLHQTIKKVGEDIEAFKFNTAVSQMMIFLNAAEKEALRVPQGKAAIGRAQWEMFLKVLAPFAPHMTEELWHKLGNTESIHKEEWPQYDESKLVSETITIAVQVNGKTRATVEVASDAGEEEVKTAAREAAAKWLDGAEVKKEILVPGRLVNLVI